MAARFDGVAHELERGPAGARFSDGVIEVVLDAAHQVSSCRLRGPHQGHTLPLWRYHALRLLSDAVLRGINPLTAAGLPAPVEGG